MTRKNTRKTGVRQEVGLDIIYPVTNHTCESSGQIDYRLALPAGIPLCEKEVTSNSINDIEAVLVKGAQPTSKAKQSHLQDIYHVNKKIDKSHAFQNLFQCNICNKKLSSRWGYNYHMQHKHVSAEKAHACSKCHKCYRTKHSLKIHELLHSGKYPFACTQCDLTFRRKNALNVHILVVHCQSMNVIKLNNCRFCSETFRFKSMLEAHSLSNHPDERQFQCNECTSAFSHLQDLRVHRKTHRGGACSMCNKVFPSSSQLAVHERTHDGNASKSVARLCGVCGKNVLNYNIHMRIHTGEKPYLCLECGRSFAYTNALLIHQRQHTGERPYLCVKCGLTFSHQSGFQYHIENPRGCHTQRQTNAFGSVNNRVKKYSNGMYPSKDLFSPHIDVADVGVKSSTSMYLKNCENDQSNCSGSLTANESKTKIFKCNECMETFKTRHRLMSHRLVVHLGKQPLKRRKKVLFDGHKSTSNQVGERIFSCLECSETFPSRYRLILHERFVHLGEQPMTKQETHRRNRNNKMSVGLNHDSGNYKFCCVQCKESFPSRYRLLLHRRHFHHQEQSLQCLQCEMTFFTQKLLEMHQSVCATNSGTALSVHPSYRCLLCEKNFRFKHELEYHEQIHFVKSLYTCTECSMQFETTAMLSEHQLKHANKPCAGMELMANTMHENSSAQLKADNSLSDKIVAIREDDTVHDLVSFGENARHYEQPENSDVCQSLNFIEKEQPPLIKENSLEVLLELSSQALDIDSNCASVLDPNISGFSVPTEADLDENINTMGYASGIAASEVIFHSLEHDIVSDIVSIKTNTGDGSKASFGSRKKQKISQVYVVPSDRHLMLTLNKKLRAEKRRVKQEAAKRDTICNSKERRRELNRLAAKRSRDKKRAIFQSITAVENDFKMKKVGENGEVSKVDDIYSAMQRRRELNRLAAKRSRDRKREHLSSKAESFNIGLAQHSREVHRIVKEHSQEKRRQKSVSMFEKRRPTRCPLCNEMQPSRNAFLLHLKQKHATEKAFACKICGKNFRMEHTLKDHERSHVDKCQFACSQCDSVFKCRTLLFKHGVIVHGNAEGTRKKTKYECQVCKLQFGLKLMLEVHTAEHHPGVRPFTCPDCPESFARMKDLSGHRARMHDDRNQCPICGKRFRERLGLHMLTHSGEKPHVCEVCGVRFSQAGNLRIHMSRHKFREILSLPNERVKSIEVKGTIDEAVSTIENSSRDDGVSNESTPGPCSPRISLCGACGKAFPNHHELKRHEKNVHSSLPVSREKLLCGTCGKEYQSKSGFKRHMVSHSGKRPHECERCGKRFSCLSIVKRHQRNRANCCLKRWSVMTRLSVNRSCLCSRCGETFTDVLEYSRHISAACPKNKAIVKNVGPGTLCGVCGRKVRSRSYLIVHLRQHTGEQPYCCGYCGRKFAYTHAYNRHMHSCSNRVSNGSLHEFNHVTENTGVELLLV